MATSTLTARSQGTIPLEVRVSKELADAAKRLGEPANRSVAGQIEHWAELGCAVEHLAPTSGLTALEAHLADPADATKTADAHVALRHLAAALADDRDRAAALKVIRDTGKAVYGAVPGREDRVQQVWPDGRRVLGRVVDQEFVPDDPGAG